MTKENNLTIYPFKIDRPLSEEEKKGAEILSMLQNAGFESYFVGGGVRDELLGLPAHDIDIATSAEPSEMEKIFPKIYDRGKKFGVMAVISDGFEFEIATFRSDIGISDHRRPKNVEFTSARNDALRRDFTINGLFFDPKKSQIIDFVEGLKDIAEKRIRFIGDPKARIDEDYLRMLRAVRFSAKFNFEIEEKSKTEILKNAGKIKEVSSERVRDELTKMLVDQNRIFAIEKLSELKVLNFILPEIEKLKGVAQPPEFHSEGDCWQHTMLALGNLPKDPSDILAWTVLLHDVAKPETQGFRDHPKSKITFFEHDSESAKKAKVILKRLKFSNDFIDEVFWTVNQHMRIVNAFKEGDNQMSERKQEKLFLNPYIQNLLHCTYADLAASLRPNGKPDFSMYEKALEKVEYFKNRPESEKENIKNFNLISGSDIMKILKINSGPKVGEIKNEIEKAFLDGKISTRKEALELLENYRV